MPTRLSRFLFLPYLLHDPLEHLIGLLILAECFKLVDVQASCFGVVDEIKHLLALFVTDVYAVFCKHFLEFSAFHGARVVVVELVENVLHIILSLELSLGFEIEILCVWEAGLQPVAGIFLL